MKKPNQTKRAPRAKNAPLKGGAFGNRKRAQRRDAGEWKSIFLAVLGKRGNVKQACTAASVSRAVVYRTLDADDAFKRAFKLAKKDAADEFRKAAAADITRKKDWKGALAMADLLDPPKKKHTHEHRGGIILELAEEIVDAPP